MTLLVAAYGIIVVCFAGIAAATREKGGLFQQDGDGGNDRGGPVADCRVAVCLSGAIRSFVHPVVHTSIRHNLIEAIEADGCEVDVFAYATRQDAVGRSKKKVTFCSTDGSSPAVITERKCMYPVRAAKGEIDFISARAAPTSKFISFLQ